MCGVGGGVNMGAILTYCLLAGSLLTVLFLALRPWCYYCKHKVQFRTKVCPSCQRELTAETRVNVEIITSSGFSVSVLLFLVTLYVIIFRDANDIGWWFGVLVGLVLFIWLAQDYDRRRLQAYLAPPKSCNAEEPVGPILTPNGPPDVPAFASHGNGIYCTRCRVTADIRMEMDDSRVVCPSCGRSEPVARVLR